MGKTVNNVTSRDICPDQYSSTLGFSCLFIPDLLMGIQTQFSESTSIDIISGASLHILTMPIRNPFAKRPDVQAGLAPYEEGIRPLSQNGTRPTFEKVDTTGSKASSAMRVKSQWSTKCLLSMIAEYIYLFPHQRRKASGPSDRIHLEPR